MPIERLRPSFSFDEERIKEFKKIAPEAFKDGKINWETLKTSLGEHLEDESGEFEHFGLFWPGKKEARKIASIPSQGTLIPVHGEGLKANGTTDNDGINDSQNIFIEGENLEVLKILQKSYAGRIKMIYIDPPYNTGNDFVYNDTFTEPLQDYFRQTGQIDEEGNPLTTNKKADGRFHSKWLSMMYPRLRVARNMLSDNGAIIVSIDNNEVHNLKLLLNEVFGEENFVECIVWQKRKGGGNDSSFIATDHEYLFIYTKQNDEHSKWRVPYEQEYLKRYRETDGIGKYYWDTLTRNGLQSPIIYDVECPDGSIIKKGKWQISEDTFKKKKENGEIRFSKKQNNDWTIHYKIRQPDGKVFRSIINNVVNGDAADEIEFLFGQKKIFDNPKPIDLIKQLLFLNIKHDDIVLDFFAGSSSTAHAVLDINKTHDLNIKFLQIQMRELINANSEAGKNAIALGYKDIFSFSRDRIKFAIQKHEYQNSFKIFKLSDSNFVNWNNYSGTNTTELETLFSQHGNSLVDNWKQEYLLTEILLIEGFPLESKISQIQMLSKNKVQKITSAFCEHQLFICLDKTIYEESIEFIQLGEKDVFVCLDNAISDQDKLRLSDKGLIKTI